MQHAVHLPILLGKLGLSTGASEKAAAAAAPRRILVVDDNRDGVASLALLLNMAGHETRTAFDGEEAVKVAEQFDPHIVLLDLGLPKLNGYDVCRRIRKQKQGMSILIVAVTGWGQDEDKMKSLDAGFDMHLVKPVEAEHLMAVLAAAP
jgi:DNA-binding response OmpR family regulator